MTAEFPTQLNRFSAAENLAPAEVKSPQRALDNGGRNEQGMAREDLKRKTGKPLRKAPAMRF